MSFNPFALRCSNPSQHSFVHVIQKIIEPNQTNDQSSSENETSNSIAVEEVKEVVQHMYEPFTSRSVEFEDEKQVGLIAYLKHIPSVHIEVLLQPPLFV